MVEPNSNFGVFWESYTPTIVKVTKKIGTSKNIIIDFPAIAGATAYKIYGSLSPSSRKLITTVNPNDGPPFDISFPITNRILPEELVFYFWVSSRKIGKIYNIAQIFIRRMIFQGSNFGGKVTYWIKRIIIAFKKEIKILE